MQNCDRCYKPLQKDNHNPDYDFFIIDDLRNDLCAGCIYGLRYWMGLGREE